MKNEPPTELSWNTKVIWLEDAENLVDEKDDFIEVLKGKIENLEEEIQKLKERDTFALLDQVYNERNELEARLNRSRQLIIALMVKLDFIGAVEEACEEEKTVLMKLQQMFDEIFPEQLREETQK